MNLDLGTLCILGVMIVLGIILLPRLLNMFGGSPYSQQGSERPTYDDPNIQSRGGFGSNRTFFGRTRGSETRTYDSPNIQSRGGFGGSRSSGSSRSSSAPSTGRSSGGARKYDSPNVQSRGGFGGSKK